MNVCIQGRRPGGVQQAAHPPQNVHDGAQGESPALVHLQDEPQVYSSIHPSDQFKSVFLIRAFQVS